MNTRVVRFGLPLVALLSLGGLGVATYLTVVHYAHQPIACSSIGDCELVNSSRYAKAGGVPVALMGALAYVAVLGGAAAAWLRRDSTLLVGTWALALASFAFSMYLTYIELRVLYAICVYCVASASILTAIFAVLSLGAWQVRADFFPAAARTSEPVR